MLKTTIFNAAGALQTFVSVFVDGEFIEDLQAETRSGAEIQIVVAVAGG
jgi:molybdopterin converting factor small subunit